MERLAAVGAAVVSGSVVGRLLGAHADRDPDALAACYAEGATVWPTGWEGPAPASVWVRDAVPAILARYPDLRFVEVGGAASAEVAMVELRMTGTADDGPMSARGVVVLDLRGGLIAAERHFWLYDVPPAEGRREDELEGASRT